MTPQEKLVEAIQAAMRSELEAEALYQKIAEDQIDPQLKAFFSKLSKDERQHYNYLKILLAEMTGNETLQYLPFEMPEEEPMHEIFSTEFLVKVAGAKDLEKALDAALLLEDDSIIHYKKLKESTDSKTLIAFFSIMIKLETVHHKLLENLRRKLLAT